MSPKVALQYLLPHRLLSRLAYGVARSRVGWFKDWLIALVVRKFKVDMAEAADPEPRNYPHFNAFFTRALRDGARTADANPDSLLMPADGKVSQVGRISEGRIFQAKGQSFTAAELLGDEAMAAPYADGWFANIYLSPRDYHRVHMPWAGTLVETLHVPGRLFTVAPWGVKAIPRLFARNERLVCHFETGFGPMCSVMVGALLVSGVESVWNGEEIPPYAHKPVRRDWRGQGITLGRMAEMARFNYGSTVILLFPRDAVFLDGFDTETPTRVGQRLGEVT
ncbi:archaetidylserine decarboxylase [Arenimonas caeni]|uniref:Phosphatidylserine decarboxylase proenzyme n=1 Tax=Arenimonas caeni TaxID=2058085 RepID=A0A2P6M9W9_9GAMM|nr:archaetidylserine decarboxylase [Arenimonas caeni]MDY0022768.1 archaetidylserine decarboxylase [Arenimonas caeni]PRH82800.1 phosphatidylserine decarboxylase [Arenimonas caeni]